MKAFRFSLETVLRFRSQQLETEELVLQGLEREKARLEQLLRDAEQAGLKANRDLASGAPSGAELVQLQAHRVWLAGVKSDLTKQLATFPFRIERQRQAVVEANRRKRLIGRLKEKRHAEWLGELDREWTNLAEDSFLSRWRKSK